MIEKEWETYRKGSLGLEEIEKNSFGGECWDRE